jgi:2-(1,2-epoxy-1,2-dihydrophenyl)acetyl-CoA isomerase
MTMPTGLATIHPNIGVERDGHVATVTIDRPASKNGCTGDMWVAIGTIFHELRYSGVRAIVLTGAGGDFCSGADLSGAGQATEGPDPDDQATDDPALEDQAPPATMLDGMRVLADVVLEIHSCPIPVVAKVDGLCVGAGLGLALATDLTWCSDQARFSAIFAKRGISLDFGTSWLLRQRLPVHKAKELALTARIVGAPEALELGLVNAVVPQADLNDAVDDLVATIAGGPPIALSLTKRELDNASSSSLAQALEAEAVAQSVNVQTADMREALTAWIERRPAHFTGQ